MTFDNTLIVDYRPTRQGTILVLALAGLALMSLLLVAGPVISTLPALVIIGYSAWWIYRLRVPDIRRLMFHSDGQVTVIAMETARGELAGTPFISPWLICLAIAMPKKRYLCLFSDSTDRDSFRRLSVWLKGA